MDLNHSIEDIASFLNLEDVLSELKIINDRLKDTNKQIVIPIVGEFSSGKTTLLNSIIDSKKLETASKPTTSVVYEIYFGQEKECAEVIFENGDIRVVEDISELKNDSFQNVSLVKIYDTSIKVPDSTILVDTPGLSSNDPKHVEALSNYLPKADALILCVDANQQITNSLLNFLKVNHLAHLPVYLIITKSDTKTSEEIEQIRSYISKNIKLPHDNLISISSQKNELSEFFSMMNKIQQNKNLIVDNVLTFKLNSTKQYLKDHILNLLENSVSDKQIEKEIKYQGIELNRLKFAIEKLISDTQIELEEVEYNTIKDFKTIISDKIDQVVVRKSSNADQEAINTINSTSSIVMANYQNEIRRKLWEVANDRRNSEFGIPLRSLEGIDVTVLNVGPLSYGIDLSSAGQEKIKSISTGIKTIGAAVAVAASTGLVAVMRTGAAASAAAGSATRAVVAGSKVNSMAKMVMPAIGNLATNAHKTVNSIQFKDNMQRIEGFDQSIVQMSGDPKSESMIEKIVGSLTDSAIGKPQRRKMINDYLDNSLIPEFKNKLKGLTHHLLQNIQNNLNIEAETKITQIEEKLMELKETYERDVEAYNKKIEDYKNYLFILNK